MTTGGWLPRRPVTDVRVLAVRDRRPVELPDTVVTEEPLQLQVAGPGSPAVPYTVTMRTPGKDFELAVGFLLSEGVITTAGDVVSVRYCELQEGREQAYNAVTVRLRRAVDPTRARGTTTTASCGVCGTTTLEQLEQRCPPVSPGDPVALDVVLSLPGRLRRAQRLFERTGGLHASGLFRDDGSDVVVREDVGRHNALDKVIGSQLLAHALPLAGHVLALSGRVSFELVHKAALAGVPVLCAVSAPSSLAVRTAERLGVCLVGFVRDGRANVYTHPERLSFDVRP